VPQGQNPPPLLQTLARTDRLGELLPILHQHAVDAVKGVASILFQFDPTGEWLQATSGYGVERLPPQTWLSSSGLVPPRMFADGRPVRVQLTGTIRGLAADLGAPSGVLVPLAQGNEPLGVLVVGCAEVPAEPLLDGLAPVGHAFALALERNRTARDTDLHRDLGALLHDFSRDVSSSFNLAAGLEALCRGTDRLFGADRSTVWLHDRREGFLNLSASSDPDYSPAVRHIPTADALAPPAIALRRERAEITPDQGLAPNTRRITIPLRGRRRALGVLVMEEVRIAPGAELEMLQRADELRRQLASALENVLLLDDVVRSRRELENIFNSLADLVVVSDHLGRVVRVNQAFGVRVGHPREDLVDRPLQQLVGPQTYTLLLRALTRTANHGTAIVAEMQDPTLNGTFLMTATTLLDEHEQPMGGVLVARDVTANAQLEADRAELRYKLIQSEKLAALGQFVAGIAHELNNPLQGVLGHLELMRTTGAFPKPLRRNMQRIYREADRAAKIVRNLLVFAGSRLFVRKRVSINAVLTRTFGLRGPALRHAGIEVIREKRDGLPRVKADPLMLQQAFLNIVLNAEQAIGVNGRIETSTTLLENPPRILVEIRDTGPGLQPDVLPRIFEPFYTTKEVGKGTGLGLAIAYGIIQEHGGQISASNHPDGGAVFSVQLPVEPS